MCLLFALYWRPVFVHEHHQELVFMFTSYCVVHIFCQEYIIFRPTDYDFRILFSEFYIFGMKPYSIFMHIVIYKMCSLKYNRIFKTSLVRMVYLIKNTEIFIISLFTFLFSLDFFIFYFASNLLWIFFFFFYFSFIQLLYCLPWLWECAYFRTQLSNLMPWILFFFLSYHWPGP